MSAIHNSQLKKEDSLARSAAHERSASIVLDLDQQISALDPVDMLHDKMRIRGRKLRSTIHDFVQAHSRTNLECRAMPNYLKEWLALKYELWNFLLYLIGHSIANRCILVLRVVYTIAKGSTMKRFFEIQSCSNDAVPIW
jgi:hypothetical protein